MSLFSHAGKSQKNLLIHIGSGSVSGAIVTRRQKEKREHEDTVIARAGASVKQTDKEEFKRYFLSMVKALNDVMEEMSEKNEGAIDRILVTINAPWFVADTRTISKKEDAEFVVTEKLVRELIQKEIAVFSKEALTHFKQKQKGDDTKYQVLDNAITGIKLNGYTITSPYGKEVHTMEIYAFTTLMPQSVGDAIKDTIMRFFGPAPTEMYSCISIFLAGMKKIKPEEKDFVIADIGEEVTDITIIRDAALREHHYFSIGTNLFISSLMKKSGHEKEQASSLLSLGIQKNANSKTEAQIADAIADARGAWTKEYTNTLALFSNEIAIPSSIFLFANDVHERTFKEALESEEFTQYLLTDRKFNVILGSQWRNTALDIDRYLSMLLFVHVK